MLEKNLLDKAIIIDISLINWEFVGEVQNAKRKVSELRCNYKIQLIWLECRGHSRMTRSKVCSKTNSGDSLACRLGRCFCFAEVSTGHPHRESPLRCRRGSLPLRVMIGRRGTDPYEKLSRQIIIVNSKRVKMCFH